MLQLLSDIRSGCYEKAERGSPGFLVVLTDAMTPTPRGQTDEGQVLSDIWVQRTACNHKIYRPLVY